MNTALFAFLIFMLLCSLLLELVTLVQGGGARGDTTD